MTRTTRHADTTENVFRHLHATLQSAPDPVLPARRSLGASLLGIGNGLPFNNPQIECPPAAHTHPDDSVYEGTDQRSFADLQQFCTTMLHRFSESSMNRAEAAEVQTVFQTIRDTITHPLSAEEQQLRFTNDYYPVGARLLEDRRFRIPQRVMIKKRDTHNYEVFYYAIECGVEYRYQEVTIEDHIVTHVATVASWVTRSSC